MCYVSKGGAHVRLHDKGELSRITLKDTLYVPTN